MKRLVEARVLCPGDVVVTSTDQRVRIAEWQLCGNRVGLRLQLIGNPYAGRPFFVPQSTRFMREAA